LPEITNYRSNRDHAIISEGLRFGFRANRNALAAKFPSIFVPGSRPTDFTRLDFIYSLEMESRRPFYTAYLGSQVLIRRATLDIALDSIASDVQHMVAEHSRQHLYLHAAVIGWRGRAVLLPGRTCAGKSTLALALARAGATYFSDEFARIDTCGLVHPFPRPFSLRSVNGRTLVWPDKEGIEIASAPCPIGAIVVTHYHPNDTWRPSRLSPGLAMIELLRNTVAVRSDPAKALRCASVLASGAVTIRSPRGDVEAAVPQLLQSLDRLLN
jgi:hypothetical protein